VVVLYFHCKALRTTIYKRYTKVYYYYYYYNYSIVLSYYYFSNINEFTERYQMMICSGFVAKCTKTIFLSSSTIFI